MGARQVRRNAGVNDNDFERIEMRHAQALKLIENQPDDLQARAAAARAEQDRLSKVAQKAKQDARLAQLAFEDAPTEEASMELFGAATVAQQQARRARRIADEHAAAVADLMRQASIETETARLKVLRESIQANSRSADFTPARDRVADIAATFRRDFRGALLDLTEKLNGHNATRREASQLASSLGTGEHFGSIKLEDVIANIVAPMNLPNWEHTGSGHVNMLCFTPNGQPGTERFKFEISGPLLPGDNK
jgi:hypothetical protein